MRKQKNLVGHGFNRAVHRSHHEGFSRRPGWVAVITREPPSAKAGSVSCAYGTVETVPYKPGSWPTQ
jgi:hypothetical protein